MNFSCTTPFKNFASYEGILAMETLFEPFGEQQMDNFTEVLSNGVQPDHWHPSTLAQSFATSSQNGVQFVGSVGLPPNGVSSGVPGLHTPQCQALMRTKMGEVTRIVRNDLHSPPIENDAFAWDFPRLELSATPPRTKSRKSLRGSFKTNLYKKSVQSPQPRKKLQKISILSNDIDEIFDRPVSPPISESPELIHNPVFKANADFFDKLKVYFFQESTWCEEVGEILESKRRNGFVFMVLERIVTPHEYFYNWCVENYFQHTPASFEDFLGRMKKLLQGLWDDRLLRYVHSFYKVATSFSQESGVGTPRSSPRSNPHLRQPQITTSLPSILGTQQQQPTTTSPQTSPTPATTTSTATTTSCTSQKSTTTTSLATHHNNVTSSTARRPSSVETHQQQRRVTRGALPRLSNRVLVQKQASPNNAEPARRKLEFLVTSPTTHKNNNNKRSRRITRGSSKKRRIIDMKRFEKLRQRMVENARNGDLSVIIPRGKYPVQRQSCISSLFV